MPTDPTDPWGPVGEAVTRWLTEAPAQAGPSPAVPVLIALGALLVGLVWTIYTRSHGPLSDPPEDHAE